MLTVHLLTAPDTRLSWTHCLLLGLPLATIIAGALTFREAPSQKRSNAATSRQARNSAARKAGPEKKLV